MPTLFHPQTQHSLRISPTLSLNDIQSANMASRRSSIHRPSLDNFDRVNEKMGGIAGATHTEVAYENDLAVSGLDSIEGTPTGKFVWSCALCASIAGSLFGYDTGIISAVLVYLGTDLNHKLPTANELEAITTLCSVGAFFGAIIAGLTADKFGRKAGIYAGYACLVLR